MLVHLSISNFAITESLEVELQPGMTVLTGETGAGKSIMLDALGLTLGDRTDSGVVRAGAERADIHAEFDISQIPRARQWLQERELLAGDECRLRRVITKEGRSRAYINGQPATVQDVRELGELLIDIHSQHAHQSLLKKPYQRELLDAFAGATELCSALNDDCSHYQKLNKRLTQLESQLDEQSAQEQLLRYQLEELDRLAIQPGEVEELEIEQKQLTNAEQILSTNHHSLALCREGEVNAMGILQQALSSLTGCQHGHPSQEAAISLLESARIQIEEAASELQRVTDETELDPQRLQQVEERLDAIYQTARKHRIQPEELPGLQESLQEQLDTLDATDEKLDALRSERDTALANYRKKAEKLSKQRRSAAAKMKKSIEAKLSELAMKHCQIEFAITPLDSDQPHNHGDEDIEILIRSNPNAAMGPLHKIASGGELSRISLAIQVVTAQVATVPTVVFDEVDVGIGGATAEIVGQLLHDLGSRSQVLCVTHQAQVASQGDQHILVQKTGDKNSVRTELHALGDDQKIEEIARMLGGIAITENTLAHAREMLATRH
ncbi:MULTISPECIES: DNA repair protein RecN [Spongiibacter]|uniref:DNA repair protein RecN n=1 Tax=Spongiibacter TaxID=630749 RepID=UPI000C53863B|nr:MULTISPECIES: DNA repair protein RecN [Spongiibacter]MAY38922.1 DNA repair protein RecN [Spongiibacter sp.]MBI56962.1 DNA repair protein RecN [Spongiibacter sp.]|tara:strand:- start:461 stop:2128 length:1668 start_codon:yes stop_codon:yes gene_type:complete